MSTIPKTGSLEAIVAAAHNFELTYDMAMRQYAFPDAIEADLEALEDAIRSYRTKEGQSDAHDLESVS